MCTCQTVRISRCWIAWRERIVCALIPYYYGIVPLVVHMCAFIIIYYYYNLLRSRPNYVMLRCNYEYVMLR